MCVCLINPRYALDPSIDNTQSFNGFNLPHLGMGYLSSYLKKNGHDVDLYECIGQDISNRELYNILEELKYPIVGISAYIDNKMNAMRIAKKIRKIKPDTVIFLGGYIPTLSYESVLKHYDVDCCVVGEGEITTLELVRAIEQGADYRQIPGIAYWAEGEAVFSQRRPLIEDLDTLPFPDRVIYKNRMLTISSSRGCVNNCIYCAIQSFYRKCTGRRYRHRSAINIVAEIKQLLAQYPDCRSIWFVDDNFLEETVSNKEHLLDFCRLLKENAINVPFNITACAKDIIRAEDALRELKAVGLNQVFVGVESLCQRQLDFYNKKTTVESNIQAIHILKKLDFKVNMGFLPFDPFVSLEEVRISFETLLTHEIEKYFFNIYSMHAEVISSHGTPLRALLDKRKLSEDNGRGYRFIHEDVSRMYSMVMQWHDIIMPMVSTPNFLMLREGNDDPVDKALQQLQLQMMYLDIDYILSLCDQVKDEAGDGALQAHLSTYEERYHAIYQAYLEKTVASQS